METLTINYLNQSSELCEIGKKYDTDKSSQRSNVTHYRHCHPYTLFYDSLFNNRRNEPLVIAELGILYGGSLLMWKDYFKHASIYGFEFNDKLIDKFKKNCDNDRITLAKIDVKHTDSIIHAFSTLNVMYDIIIEDTTHKFEDQIRIIENVYPYLKPGGMLIIEDIFKSTDVSEYKKALEPILHHFQTYYFVEVDHVNKYSAQWNNDKLFVLIKSKDSSTIS
jgi:predicted O-methyltransferase YrrM